MSTLHFATKHPNKATVKHDWYLVDAQGKTVGRLASKIASILMGKNKPYFSRHVDCGDYIIVNNVEKVVFTGNKKRDKQYIRFSGYPGGKKETSAAEMLERNPSHIMEVAVQGMLPKNRLGRQIMKKLFLYVGDQARHTAQKPKLIKL